MSELVKLCKILAGSSGERNSPHVPLKEFLEGHADALAPTLPHFVYCRKTTTFANLF